MSFQEKYGKMGLFFAVTMLSLSGMAQASSWSKVATVAPADCDTMFLLTDGTIMIQNYDNGQSWMRLTPDAKGDYANGSWTASPIKDMGTARIYFASQVLPDGNVWVQGGEYSGPNLDSNFSGTGEIYDTVAGTWTPIAPYPSQSDCPKVTVTSSGNTTAGSPIITGIPDTSGFQVGNLISGKGIPAKATVSSIDSVSQVHISANATVTSTGETIDFGKVQLSACFGDDPSVLLSSDKILAGNIIDNTTFIYNIAANTWTPGGTKVYKDESDEEGWAKLSNGDILTYDIFQSVAKGVGYAELYSPKTNTWTDISPVAGTAQGTLPLLSSDPLGYELGPVIRLQDGRIFVIGANGQTALYTPETNTWAAGPTAISQVDGVNVTFGADDAPASLLPNGQVLFVADTGPDSTKLTGDTMFGSPVITNIPSTSGLQPGLSVDADDIPEGSTIVSVDSATQIHVSANATDTVTGEEIDFGGLFSGPSQIFTFDPESNTISTLSPSSPDAGLGSTSSYNTRLLELPNGQTLLDDGTNQLYVYTPDGSAKSGLEPKIEGVAYKGGGKYVLTGKKLNGPSAGSSYGDDVQTDENYPIVRLVDGSGLVYYARTTNWSITSVGVSKKETVDFTLNPSMPAGHYHLIVSGTGISSAPHAVHITRSEVAGQSCDE